MGLYADTHWDNKRHALSPPHDPHLTHPHTQAHTKTSPDYMVGVLFTCRFVLPLLVFPRKNQYYYNDVKNNQIQPPMGQLMGGCNEGKRGTRILM